MNGEETKNTILDSNADEIKVESSLHEEESNEDVKTKPDNAAASDTTGQYDSVIEQSSITESYSRDDNNRPIKALKGKKWIKIGVIVAVAIILLYFGINFFGNQIVEIKASYKGGNAGEGVVLDADNNYITVSGISRFGKTVPIKNGEWTIDDPATLKKDTVSTVIIKYKRLSTELDVECTDSAIVSFDIKYLGKTTAGTVIDDKSHFNITVKYRNGKTSSGYSDWKIVSPVTLEADSSAEIEIKVENIIKKYSIECSTRTPKSISATYNGSLMAGTVLDKNNKGIVVTAQFADGTEAKITDFSVKEAKTLVKGETSTIVIEYLGAQCELSVEADKYAYFSVTFKEMIDTINNAKGFNSTISSHINDANDTVYSADIDVDEEKYSNAFYYYNKKSRFTEDQLYASDDAIPGISDPINVVAFKFTDHTKNTFDSKPAKVAGEMGVLMGQALGDLTINFNTMLNEGESLSLGNKLIITYTHGKYIYMLYACDHSLGNLYFYDYTFRIGITENYD